jgi:hypothetical protein
VIYTKASRTDSLGLVKLAKHAERWVRVEIFP